MAEITKVTTPMLPKENIAGKLKPVTDQAFELTDPAKVHKADQDGKSAERQPESGLLKESMGRPAIAPLLRDSGDMMQVLKKIAFLVEMGVSASDAVKDTGTQELLKSLFISPEKVAGALMEQDKASVLFKGEAFDILRDIQAKFGDSPKIRDAIANLLKIFDYNVNTQNSIKTILHNCNNILDYMFSKDRIQFSGYLKELADMLLPFKDAEAFAESLPAGQAQEQVPGQTQAQEQSPGQTQTQEQIPGQTQTQEQIPGQTQAQGQVPGQTQAQEQIPGQPQTQGQVPGQPQTQEQEQEQISAQDKSAAAAAQRSLPELSQREAAQVLKNNLLPLLGEIVVKYHQNEHIRDVVMVVVHNIVRVDQGTPEALRDAINKLINELSRSANVPPGFEKQLFEAVRANIDQAKNAPNSTISKISDMISETLSSPDANPAMVKQAGNMLVSMLQNQSTIMDILHFVIPFQTPQGQVFTELYVDPEAEEKVGKQKGKSHKIFLSVESEAHGSFELSFLETGDHVDFYMWCPEELVKSLSGLKRQFADMMRIHGYTMNSFGIDEMKAQHSVAEVFPRLLERKVGIDVQI